MKGILKGIAETKYRMRLRKALSNETEECLRITLEETRKEIERRNKKK